MTKQCIKESLKATIPVFLGYISCGIAFGLVTINAGYPWWLALFMSIFIFAGAGQFVAIPLFATNTSIIVILITELLLNIRHIVYGLPLINKFKECKKFKAYLIFSLTDETFSLLTTTNVPVDVKEEDFYFMISLLNHFYWVVGSIIGALAGLLIPFDMTGVDFSLTALFAVLTINQFEKLYKSKNTMNVSKGKEICQ